MTEIIKSYIDGKSGRVVFRCCSKLEVDTFFDIVRQVIEPERHCFLYGIQNAYGYGYFKNEICYRIERGESVFDYGHDQVNYYRRIGYKIVDVADLFTPNDFGEFETNDVDMNGLIFGGM